MCFIVIPVLCDCFIMLRRKWTTRAVFLRDALLRLRSWNHTIQIDYFMCCCISLIGKCLILLSVERESIILSCTDCFLIVKVARRVGFFVSFITIFFIIFLFFIFYFYFFFVD